jgi:hypothetical protein
VGSTPDRGEIAVSHIWPRVEIVLNHQSAW